VIVDFHTHIFPSEVREQRQEYIRRDPTFAEMYGDPKAKIATTEELLDSMERSGVDVSVALGFAWRDHETCVRHNDYLLESAASSGGRIIAFCTVNMGAAGAETEIERCARGGARGLGELRPESQGWELNGEPGERLAALAERLDLILLFHVTEPTEGNSYPGKEGLGLASFYSFAVSHRQLGIVGAHLGGGLPFFVSAEELPAISHVYIDAAARRFLYTREAYRQILNRVSREQLILGSDYPLVSQRSEVEAVCADTADEEARELVLSGNAARLLRLAPRQ